MWFPLEIVYFSRNNQENQFLEYTMTIHNITFEDAADLKIVVKSSLMEKMKIIRPQISSQ